MVFTAVATTPLHGTIRAASLLSFHSFASRLLFGSSLGHNLVVAENAILTNWEVLCGLVAEAVELAVLLCSKARMSAWCRC